MPPVMKDGLAVGANDRQLLRRDTSAPANSQSSICKQFPQQKIELTDLACRDWIARCDKPIS